MKRATINGGAFNKIIEATKAFQSKNNRHAMYKFIRLEFHSELDEVRAIAVDGHRLSVEHAVAQSEEDFTVYVHGNVKLPKNSVVEIELVEKEVILRCDGYVFGYRQPDTDEGYLDWKNVIPDKEPAFRIGFNGDYLLSALQAAKASVGGTYKTPVVLEFYSPLEPVVIRTNKHDIKLVLPVRLKD